ncbi:hypothetical protein GBF38_023330 [Nibea albiflora]|uniref:Uncharacterized protein n=1 Tax=Nibea albiflora TaxID=240163 RepID=A0ACB7F281_NIBAL|nr:hypothetical protein GBF38_023330 [Nibea albiflora]
MKASRSSACFGMGMMVLDLKQMSAATDETQQEVKAKPVPQPWATPQPVHPPPRPPLSKYVNWNKPPAADNGGHRYVNSYPNTALDLHYSTTMQMFLIFSTHTTQTDLQFQLGSPPFHIRLFNERATNVKKALRLYNLLMMTRGETLRQIITEFNSISHSLDKVQKKTKTIGIAGGTTGAVGGVTAVLGIALAPMTMGISLIATAVGAGMVASAGGVGAAQAAKAKKKIVNKVRVEKLAFQYIKEVGDLECCLDFILTGMDELRRHDLPRLQRARVQADAVNVAHLSQSVLTNNKRRGSANTRPMSPEKLLKAFIHELDPYFKGKDCQKLKKSNESKFSARVHLLAENLQDDLDHMIALWETFSLYV